MVDELITMNEKKISPKKIKLANRQMIYRYIRNHDSASKQDIVIALKLSLPTVTQNLQYLEEQGLIDTSQKIKYTGGRNATAYTYIKQAKMAIGLYITGNHINGVAVDLSGNVVYVVKERIKFNLEDETYLKKIAQVVTDIKEKVGIADQKLLGVGIAVPGLISQDRMTVSYGLTLNFTGKTHAEIAKYIPYKSRLFHDSFCAGYAEAWLDPRIQNAFYISLSNSVGGSVITSKSIYEGNSHKAGEIGHVILSPADTEQCYCGQYGCFDTLCRSGKLDQHTEGSLEQFFIQLEAGDPTIHTIWNQYLDHLSLAIHNIRMLFDSTIILGGYVGAHIEPYMPALYARADERNPFRDAATTYLIPCKYKVEATAAGAALHYIETYIDNI